jgi:hypothetical protein
MPSGVKFGIDRGAALLSASGSADGAEGGPIEVGIELVQTMSEKAPTLLVRTRRAPVATSDEGRD